MPTPRSRQAARVRAHRHRAQRRARRLIVLAFMGGVAVITVLLIAFGGGGTGGVRVVLPASTSPPSASLERPQPEILATVGNLQLVVPAAARAVTGIGYHRSRDGALELKPAGYQLNEGLLARLWRRIVGRSQNGPVWYQLAGPGTEVVDIGVAPGTDIYAPAGGTVVGITADVIGGVRVGARIDIRPTAAPSTIVSIRHLRPDPVLSVGSAVTQASSKLGTAVDIAAHETQALARHTRDRGNNVAISVYSTAGSLP